MRTTTLAFIACAGAAVAALTLGCALNGSFIAGGMALLVGALWLAAFLTHQWQHAPKIGGLYIIGAALGLLTNQPAGLMLACAVLALCGWDLAEFEQRLTSASRVEQEPALQRLHLLRLSMIALAGFVLGALALLVHVSFSFGVAVALAGLAVIVLVVTLRRALLS